MATKREIARNATTASDLIELAQADLKRGGLLDAAHSLHLAENRVQLAIRSCVELARERGATWFEVGLALSITQQGAQQRYGPRPTAAVGAAAEIAAGQRVLYDD